MNYKYVFALKLDDLQRKVEERERQLVCVTAAYATLKYAADNPPITSEKIAEAEKMFNYARGLNRADIEGNGE